MPESYDIVHTLTDYYDGPKRGIADFKGVPHFYESRWDEQDDGTGTFMLQPIDDETFNGSVTSLLQAERDWLAVAKLGALAGRIPGSASARHRSNHSTYSPCLFRHPVARTRSAIQSSLL